jgi:hypothetical protein
MTSTPPIPQPLRAGIWRRARDRFLLEDVERQVRSRLPEQQAVVRRYHRAAARRAADADELADLRSMASSMVLYRDAVRLFIAAAVTAHDIAADPRALLADTDSPWEALAGLWRRKVIAEPPREVEVARKILDAEHEPLAFDQLAPEQLLAQWTTMKQAAAWLRGLVEPRTLRRIRAERVLRVSMLGIVTAAVLTLGTRNLVVPTNLALHRPVSISARHPSSTAPEDNSGLVNGLIESNYGVHTKLGGGWVVVDLQDIYELSKIKIFNRADAWFDSVLPMRLELSENSREWKEVARRTTTFTASSPWVFEAQGVRARYVRLASDTYVALTEVEVFGKH